ncbi:MAG: hypothetical protein IPO27_10130 [Bacteroidetes bacterium]|nr:hypothetical protein [Bacteroidota bacterium]
MPKEHLVNKHSYLTTINSLVKDGSYPCKVNICNGVVQFVDTPAYEDVYACLEAEYETWNDDFDAAHMGMSDDQIQDEIDITGWDENYELHQFYINNSFSSYFAYLDVLENNWLLNGNWNPTTDPELLDYFDDDITNSFFNSNGMLLIGTTLLVIDNKGELWTISNANCNTILSTSQDPALLQNTPNATLQKSKPPHPNGCLTEVREIGYHPYSCNSKDRFFKAKIKYVLNADESGSIPLDWKYSQKFKGKVTAYRKKNNKWKRARTILFVKVEIARTYDCQDIESILPDENGPKQRSKLKKIGYASNNVLTPYFLPLSFKGTFIDMTCNEVFVMTK